MPRLLSRKALLLVVLFPAFRLAGQSVIIHEVSNGPAGSQEYVELLVVPTTPVEPCTPVSCLDLRGWILDDNNGYHGPNGVAQGAVRFADHPLWSCVPVGTLITVYNAEDINPTLPPMDVDLADGNCNLVIPSSDVLHLEYSDFTPAAVLCDDPGGWGLDPTPTWQSNLALANTGDCMRISDASGCLVFSFCYGNANTNATVHFPGNGGDQVWSFVDGDPTNAADWVQGCAGDLAACGGDDQTPGSANSAANAAWLATFNNGCAPVVPEDPLAVTADGSSACDCTGTASAEASGSSGPYAFTWYNADWSLTGQVSAAATDLCAGTYHVIVISATGCRDTATVVLDGGAAPDAGTDATIDLCSDAAAVDLFAQLGGTPDAGGQWTPALPGGSLFDPTTDPAGSYTYSLTPVPGCPPASATVTVSIGVIPVVTVSTTDESCAGADDGSITLDMDPPGGYTVTWSDGLPDGVAQTGLSAGTWDVRVSSTVSCFVDLTVSITSPTAIEAEVTTEPAQCGNSDGSACVEVSGGSAPYAIAWDDALAQNGTCANDLGSGTYVATITDTNGCTITTEASVGSASSDFTVSSAVTNVSCAGEADGAIDLTIEPPGNYAVAWEGPDGYGANGASINDLLAGGYAYVVTDPLGCSANGNETVSAPLALELELTTEAPTCAGACDGSVLPSVSGGVQPWSYMVDAYAFNLPIDAVCGGDHTLTVEDAQGCTLTLPFTMEEGPAGIPPSIIGPEALCSGDDPVALEAEPAGGIWNGDGMDDDGYFDPANAGIGSHLISYTLPCASPAELVVAVVPMPQARFDLPTDGDLVVNTSTSATLLQWYVAGEAVEGDPDLLLPPAPTNGEDEAVTICLAVRNDLGCADSTCSVYAYPTEVAVHVPNAFTPNDDLFNDRFQVQWLGPTPSAYNLLIFDRWGRTVFTASDKDLGWDGTSGGTTLPIGVYPWRLQATVNKEPILLNGHVTLVR